MAKRTPVFVKLPLGVLRLLEVSGRREPHYLQALEIRRATLGEEPTGFAESLGNVAVFYESVGRYDEAERLQTQTLEIREEKLGEMHHWPRA
ncbi:MAG: tetratricopeptide repeat protein [Planctomycetota bacterium]